MACLAMPTLADLQFSRGSWLLITQISEQIPLGSHVCMCKNKLHRYLWISSRGNYRGFALQAIKKVKKSGGRPSKGENDAISKARWLRSRKPNESMNELPNMLGDSDVNKNVDVDSDPTFSQRLETIRRAALEKKESEERKKYQPIDYDVPISKSEGRSLGLGAKVGIGVAVLTFALVFAFGDFIPSGSGEKQVEQLERTADEKASFEAQLQRFEETLKSSPEDLEALEGAAVTHAELGEYREASVLLEKLTQKSTENPDAFRLLGDVRYALGDYDGSVVAYRSAMTKSSRSSLEVLRGLTNALLAAKKPNEAVQELLSAKDRLSLELNRQDRGNVQVDESSNQSNNLDQVDPVQVDLLLGKAYSNWGHVGDATAVYDSLIATRPNDFRGYLAKGILLKENGKSGDAERMFIQAKYLAPPKNTGCGAHLAIFSIKEKSLKSQVRL
ncbi:hypothetical protein SUGI_0087740 [Cryptomeria japonica]|nr:hypothetical protein SUGI_0087740 [Cryptomeria japonica]